MNDVEKEPKPSRRARLNKIIASIIINVISSIIIEMLKLIIER
tara:strand:- start:703 stop:831 length:129 start_codon:yes stop_codon:yes gene_type:complete